MTVGRVALFFIGSFVGGAAGGALEHRFGPLVILGYGIALIVTAVCIRGKKVF